MSKLNWVTKACAIFVLWAAAAAALHAQTLTTLHAFNGVDGDDPVASLVQGADGNFYGTTEGGLGPGTVFEMTPDGKLASRSGCLRHGCVQEFMSALIQVRNGAFYGTTYGGGAYGSGTIFKLTSAGDLTVVYSFCSQEGCPDGVLVKAGLVQGPHDDLYGTTGLGGANGDGTVFKITSSGTLTTLHDFDGTDGESPDATLFLATDGNFYGTTPAGGANKSCDSGFGCGTVFKITPSGALTTLYSFCSQADCSDGERPEGALAQGSDGNFYGATSSGGLNNCGMNGVPSGCGTIFKLTPAGALTTLYMFCSNNGCADGENPPGALVQGTDGNFYGTTSEGGNSGCYYQLGCGTIFKITPGGALTTLYVLCSKGGSDCTDGANPYAGLIQGTDGNFYGTASGGGIDHCAADQRPGFGESTCGTIFSLSVGLGPFVETNPVAGKVGAKVEILGTNLTGATSVTFNGTAAGFKVHSPTLIVAEVPSGATTGTIQVQLPTGTLSSNMSFIVLR